MTPTEYMLLLAGAFPGAIIGCLATCGLAARHFRRLRTDTWADASRYYARQYHALLTNTQPPARKLP